MTNSYVDSQNRMLSVLGYVCGGTKQRFKWLWSDEIVYWKGRMKPCWVLAQWETPKVVEKFWVKEFPEIPYPANGMYHAKPETIISGGEVPDCELTAQLIASLDRQMSKTEQQHCAETSESVSRQKQADESEWTEFVQDTNPAFSNFDWGSRHSNVSFGGIS